MTTKDRAAHLPTPKGLTDAMSVDVELLKVKRRVLVIDEEDEDGRQDATIASASTEDIGFAEPASRAHMMAMGK